MPMVSQPAASRALTTALRYVVSALSCSMVAACGRSAQSPASLNRIGRRSWQQSETMFVGTPLRVPFGHNCGENFMSGRKALCGRTRNVIPKRLNMGGTDAGYAFEDYAAKRASFEPSSVADIADFTVPWPQYYCAPDLDRTIVPSLHNSDAFESALRKENARFIVIFQGQNLVRQAASGEGSEAVFLHWDEVKDIAEEPDAVKVCLGEEQGVVYFALDVSHKDDFTPPPGSSFEQLRSVGGLLSRDEDAGLLASARGMSVWHRSLKHCTKCGSESVAPVKAGAGRRCGSCGAGFYPRLDPSVIALVTDERDEHVLLGRKESWPRGRYSILAGFTEMGESLEETVVREVLEESGVRVRRDSISFFASQPWPFPRSLMIGFTCVAEESGLPHVEFPEDEMQDVRWFSRSEVVDALRSEGDLSIPGRAALARSMIARWAAAPPSAATQD